MTKKILRLTVVIAIAISILVIIAGITAATIFYFYPEDSVLNIIKTKSETILNRKVEISSLKYSHKGVVLTEVKIFDRDPKSKEFMSEPFIKSEEVILRYSLLSLLKKEFKIKSIYFNNLNIKVIFDSNGISNIEKIIKEISAEGTTEGKTQVLIEKIILTNSSVELISTPKDFRPLEGKYSIDCSIKLKNNYKLLNIFDAGITLPQNRGKLYPELTADFESKPKITGRIKVENLSIGWLYEFADNPVILPFETVNGFIDNFTIDYPFIRGKANAISSLKNTKNKIEATGSCEIDLENRSVVIDKTKSRLNNSTADLDNLTISYKYGTIPKFSVSNINYSIADLRLLERTIPSGFSGSLRGNLSYNTSGFTGKVSLIDLSFRDRVEVFSELNTEIEIANNNLKKENIPVTIFGSKFYLSIATLDNKFQSLYISARGEKIDLNAIKFSSGKSSSDFCFALSINGKISVNEILYDKFVFKNNQADFAASAKKIKLNRFQTSILSGNIAGTGDINLDGEFPSVSLNSQFHNIKVNDIKFSDESLNNRFFGFCNGTADLSFKIKENMTETIKGNATFEISKGKIVNTGIQNGLIIFLAELRYKLKDLEFSKIYGNIDINGENFLVNSFIFNSEDLRLSLRGRFNSSFVAENVDMKLEFNNHFIKDIPRPAMTVFKDYLSGNWYVIPFSINGNISESKNIKMLKKNN